MRRLTPRPRVLVVYKKDAYQQYVREQRDPHLLRLLHRRHPDLLDMQQAHQVHEGAIEEVTRALRGLGVSFDLVYRADLKAKGSYDLIVSVGGDGTFLQAARCAYQLPGGRSSHTSPRSSSRHPKRRNPTPILGVNSDPSRSEAVFCAATQYTFEAFCRLALQSRLPVLRLYRLGLRVNGVPLALRALNDVLIVHDDPATMSRYRLRIGSREEAQKSSGLWVSTAAGSSSAVLAAGGARLPWGVKRFQYRPREVYCGRLSRARLTGSVLSDRTRVRITWLMRRGTAFIDGPHVRIPLTFADEIEIFLSLSDPLSVLRAPSSSS